MSRRDKIVKALCDVELNMNSQFSIRRLKAVIHQNGSGEAGSHSSCKWFNSSYYTAMLFLFLTVAMLLEFFPVNIIVHVDSV